MPRCCYVQQVHRPPFSRRWQVVEHHTRCPLQVCHKHIHLLVGVGCKVGQPNVVVSGGEGDGEGA
jgi:hypothetical protein